MNSIEKAMNNKKNKDILEKNYRFFINQLPELLEDDNKKNKIALIKDEQIIGFYEDIVKAIEIAKQKNFKLETFLVQKIEKQRHYVSRVIT